MDKIKGFDGIRAICAFMVLYSHSEFSITHIPEEGFWLGIYNAGLSGGAGVLVFFVLSGYLISQLLWKELQRTGSINYGYFIMRRVLRLLPAYLLYLTVLTLLVVFDFFDVKAIALVSAFTYTYNFLPATFGSGYTNHLWSLSVEEQFYLLFPLFMKRVTQAFYQWAILVIIVVGIILINLIVNVPLPDYEFVHEGQVENLKNIGLERIFRINTLFIPAGLYCLVGCFFGLTYNSLARLLEKNRLVLAIMIAAGTLLYFNLLVVKLPFYGVSKTIQSFGVGLLLVCIHFRQTGWVVRALSFGPLPYLGKISYGTYVWHGIFIATGPGACIYWWQGVPFGFPFTYFTAAFSYEFLEKPFLALKSRYRIKSVTV